MAGAKGRSGRRPGDGIRAEGFREWCRAVASLPEVRQGIIEKAKTDPEFALKVSEHGYGRPPQALDVRHGNLDDTPLEFTVTFSDGAALYPGNATSTAALPVPTEPAE